MSTTVLFIDTVTPRPYAGAFLLGVGGTEQAVVDVSQGLIDAGYSVWVEQHCRDSADGRFVTLGSTAEADIVITLRDPSKIPGNIARFPKAKHYLWAHDLTTRSLGEALPMMQGLAAYVCVSKWHVHQTLETFRYFGYTGEFKLRHAYNPLPQDMPTRCGTFEPYRLVFMSSPHKGLRRTLDVFKILHEIDSRYILDVYNPGYLPDMAKHMPGVTFHGNLMPSRAREASRGACALFFVNSEFPETFGRVFSEANAMGMPVLTHRLGAASEVLDPHPDQFVDCRSNEAVIKRIMKWSDGARPIVRGKPQFKLDNVIKTWENIFNDVK